MLFEIISKLKKSIQTSKKMIEQFSTFNGKEYLCTSMYEYIIYEYITIPC